MARPAVSRGYMEPPPETVNVESFQILVGNQVVDRQFEDEVHWDYETPLHAKVLLNVDLQAFSTGAGFLPSGQGSDRRFKVHIVWTSTRTKQQGSSEPEILRDGAMELVAAIPSELVGGTLEVSLSIFLSEFANPAANTVPAKRAGSRLWHGPRLRVQLEGVGSRLTISTREFGRVDTDPASALWKITVSDDLHLPAELGISVVLNTGQASIVQLLEKPSSPKSKVLADWLESEIRASMLTNFLLVQDRDALIDEEFEEGTLGEAMLNLAELIFPNRNILDMPRDPGAIMAASHIQTRK